MEDVNLITGKAVDEENSPDKITSQMLPSEGDIAEHLVEIQKRRLGYAFGGPEKVWCDASVHAEHKGITLPTNPADNNSEMKSFTGCVKYATCELIPDAYRWTRWEDLTESQRQELLNLRCYRATRGRWNAGSKKILDSNESSWDPEALTSRQESRWIANPFGVRTVQLGGIAREVEQVSSLNFHRDFAPCPVGGCVTPEMQRDYAQELQATANPDNFWTDAKACPFYFRHIDIELTKASPNPQRFSQCYVTLPEVRKQLEKLGVVVVAPVYRTFVGSEASYSYTFYSGLSFIQLPTRAPDPGVKGWIDPSLPLRWQATAATRREITERAHHLPIDRLFEDAEHGMVLAPWEREARVISVSEGQSTAILLQWVLLRRLQAVLEQDKANFDIHQELEWRFDEYGIVKKLSDWGYPTKGILNINEQGFAKTTLTQDLCMLGLYPSPEHSARLRSCIAWLAARYEQSEMIRLDSGFRNLIQTWLPARDAHSVNFDAARTDSEAQLWEICWLFLLSAMKWTRLSTLVEIPAKLTSESLRTIRVKDIDKLRANVTDFNNNVFPQICRLVPPMHAIVRANWTAPLRWLFVPLAEGNFDKDATRPRLYDGLIIILEDDPDLSSLPYQGDSDLSWNVDSVLKRLSLVLPLLTAVSDIEEGYVREAFDFYVRRQATEVGRISKTANSDIIAVSGKMKDVLELVDKVAPARSTVLITGESGTGKELIAKAVHEASPRAAKPFVGVNTSNIHTGLLESELFGHTRGAFTGAIAAKKGLFEVADGGSIFLDEIGDIPPETQVRLLRVIQEREFTPLGETSPRRVDVRIIAATNIDLKEAVRRGTFREDLYYRLAVVPIELSPLRDRVDDILPLAQHFIQKYNEQNGRRVSELIADDVLSLLKNYGWPGNVRELENVIERAVILAPGDEITYEYLKSVLLPHQTTRRDNANRAQDLPAAAHPSQELEERIRDQIRDRMKKPTTHTVQLFRQLVLDELTSDHQLIWDSILCAVRVVCTEKINRYNHFAYRIGALLSLMAERQNGREPYLKSTALDSLVAIAGVNGEFPSLARFKGKLPKDPEAQNSYLKFPLRQKLSSLIMRKLHEHAS